MMRSRKVWLGVTAAVVGMGVTALWAAGTKAAGDGQVMGRLHGLCGALAAAPGEAPGGKLHQLIMGHIGRMLTLHSELGLTDQQHQQIHAVVEGHKKEIATVASNVIQKKRVLRDAVLADTPDEAAIRKASDDLGKSIGDAAVLASKVAGEVKPILTPEQIEKIKKVHADDEAATDEFLKGVLAE